MFKGKRLLILLVMLYGWANHSFGQHSKSDSHSFVLATWNVGHFDYGLENDTVLKTIDDKERLEIYKDFIYRQISSEVLCVNEYDDGECVFGNKYIARKSLFNRFRTRKVFNKFGVICNALFCNLEVKNIDINYYDSSYIEKLRNERSHKFYYITADIHLNNKRVVLVCTHMDWTTPELIQKQIEELIEKCSIYDRVIMCGDWNTMTYNKFIKAGYILANDGSLITYPSKSYALDNIIVKGVNVSEVRVIKTGLSDHYPLICKITID